MTSEKQISANRLNAKKGGVKTAEGKSVSKLNSIKHGILSEEIVIERGQCSENAEQYDEIRASLFEEFQPVGELESMLVDDLCATSWRRRRVVRAERALIEHAIVSARLRRELDYAQKPIKYDHFPNPEEDVARLEKYQTSLIYVELIQDVRQIIHFIEHGFVPLPKILKDRVDANFGVAHQLSPHREELLACNEAIETKDYHGRDKEYYQKQILVASKELLDMLIERAEKFATREDVLFIAEEETHVLLNERDVQRIQRYESHLHRIFLQTLHELQRVQSIRLGKPMPLAAALDVTMNSENGFVS
jgi:hypothetical protein